jgi:hypothetical protein
LAPFLGHPPPRTRPRAFGDFHPPVDLAPRPILLNRPLKPGFDIPQDALYGVE